jgi:hypothetical protein
LVTDGGDRVSFGSEGQLIFRQLGDKANYLARIALDGTGLIRILDSPIMNKGGVSPKGDWAMFGTAGTNVTSVARGIVRKICNGPCPARWSADDKYLYVATSVNRTSAGRTLVIPLSRGFEHVNLPASGLDLASDEELARFRVIPQGAISPGPDPQTYAFSRSVFQGNLFRIPLHQ